MKTNKELVKEAFIEATTLYKNINVNDWYEEFKLRNPEVEKVSDVSAKPEEDLIYRIMEQWGNAVHPISEMVGWLKEYASNERKVSDVSAEKILDKHYESKMHWKSVNRENVLNAMEEYASIVNERKDNAGINDAIEFAEWLRKNNMSHNGFGGWGGGKINVNFYGSKTTDLYKLFQESQTQKK